MKITLLFFLMIISLPVYAQEDNCDPMQGCMKPSLSAANEASSSSCMHPAKLANLCHAVGLRVPNNDPNGNYEYRYQKHIFEAACIDASKDSGIEISSKISSLWDTHQDKLKCNNTQFSVTNGSVLKYAVAKTFTPFIEDAIEVWKVNLNHIDSSDGRTLLDYVAHELKRNEGTPNEKILQLYYAKLKAAGAKHKYEL